MYRLIVRQKFGLTLIEILVVITIISILATVVFSSLNSARDKGADATVKSNLIGLRDQASIYYDDQGYTYTGLCTTDTNTMNAMDSSKKVVAGILTLGGYGDGECFDTAPAWAAWVNLKNASTSAWCVDSVGNSSIIPTQNSSAVDLTVCP